jgi:hypothetical protein
MNIVGSRHLLPNDPPPKVSVNRAKLRCVACDELVCATWRDDENMSPTAVDAMDRWRQDHRAHAGFEEALPVIGELVFEDYAPPVGGTLYDRHPMSVGPPPECDTADEHLPAPDYDLEDLGDGSRFSHYPGL